MTKNISISLIVAAAVILGTWAIVVASNDTQGDEVSVVILEWASRAKSVPLALGILMGHWLWPSNKIRKSDWKYYNLSGLMLLAGITDLAIPSFTIFPLVPFVFGVFSGHCLWPQKVRS